MFQFTHPGRGATCISSSRALSTSAFQFTHPGRGATPPHCRTSGGGAFQFTHPGRGATQTTIFIGKESPFQFTHPGRGATVRISSSSWASCCFNSRTPGGVRLGLTTICTTIYKVSIHAPREGCDWSVASVPSKRTEFQFTHPGRGATKGLLS